MRFPRIRRGSTLVMVAFMLIPLMAVMAIAVDIGRFYVVTGELQTAADAAALAGARKLQLTGGTNPEATVDAAVVAFVASTNHADGSSLAVTSDSVRMAFWTPTNGNNPATLTYTLNGKRPNAVTVGISGAPRGIFAQIVGHTVGLSMSRQATAWIANLGSNCVRPWAFPYLPLYKKVSGNAAAVDVAPDLDPAQFFAYESSDSSQRMFTMLGANQSTTKTNHGNWRGFNFTGNAGKPDFIDGIQGCRNYPINTDAGNGKTLPGSSNNYVKWSTQAIDGICVLKNNDAGCYPSAASTKPGVTINTAWGDFVGGNGSGEVVFRYVGEFVLKCYYTGPGDVCPYPEPGTPNTGYPEGTLVGYMQGLKSRIITPDDVPGNNPSNLQRILLVK